MDNLNPLIQRLIRPGGVCPGISIAYGTHKESRVFQYGTDGTKGGLSDITLFDLASVTKLFLSIVYMRLLEYGIVDFHRKISDYTDVYANIGDVTVSELLSFNVLLKTDRRVDACSSFDEGWQLIHNIEGQKCKRQVYSDMPAIVLGDLIEIITGKSFGAWLNELIIKPFNLSNTGWTTDFLLSRPVVSYEGESWLTSSGIENIGNRIGRVNDQKAYILSGNMRHLCGHAGLFSSTEDITVFCQNLLNERIISRVSMNKMVEGAGWNNNAEQQSFGYMCYRKYLDEIQTEVPLFMSDYAFASSGYTGCYLFIDPEHDVFVFIGGNRLNSCVSKNNTDIIEKDGCFEVNGVKYRSSVNYVYQRDALKNELCKMALIL